MPFSSLFGLDPAVAALRRALNHDRLPGTYLFVGPEGVGKSALARAFAEAAACVDPALEPYDACGRCGSCTRAAAGVHPEVVVVAPSGDQTQIWQFWDREGKPEGVLERSLWHAPVVGRRRVYIVERADTLNEAAANSLLKVLEEPPPYAVFVLLAPHASRLLPTVLSRAQMVRLAPAPVAALAAWLEDTHAVPGPTARRAAAYAEGCTGRALQLALGESAQHDMDRLLEYALALAQCTHLGALREAERLREIAGSLGKAAPSADPDENGDEPAAAPIRERVSRQCLAAALDAVLPVFRDLLALSLDAGAARIVHVDALGRLAAAAGCRSPAGWRAALDALMTARRRLDQNVSITLLTDAAAVQVAITVDR